MQLQSTMPSSGYNWSKKPETDEAYHNAVQDAIRLHRSINPNMSLDTLLDIQNRLWFMAEVLEIAKMYRELAGAYKLPEIPGERSFVANSLWYQLRDKDDTMVFQNSNRIFVPGNWVLELYDMYQEHLRERSEFEHDRMERQRKRVLEQLGVQQ